jgi:hypothetical protein
VKKLGGITIFKQPPFTQFAPAFSDSIFETFGDILPSTKDLCQMSPGNLRASVGACVKLLY